MLTVVIDQTIPLLANILKDHCSVQCLPFSAITPPALEKADALFIRTTTPITATMLQETQIQWIGSASAGFDHVDTHYCDQKQLVFRYAPGSNAHAVADYVMACVVLCQEKRAPKPWHSASVIGVGHVGTSVAHRLKQQGLNPLLYDPIRAQREPGFLGCSLEACLQCDLICLHPALTVSGPYPSQHLINTRNIHLLPTGAVLINASRGEIIEEAALKTRPDLILCLDVWDHEPHIDQSLLEQVFIGTPHIAGYSRLAKIRASLQLLEQFKNDFNLDIPLPQVAEFEKSSHPLAEASSILDIIHPLQITQQLRDYPFSAVRSSYPLREESRVAPTTNTP